MTDEEPASADIAVKAKQDISGVLAQLGPTTELGRARRRLLPIWIKAFSWIFLIGGGAAPAVVLVGLLGGRPVFFELFGFAYRGNVLDPEALLLALLVTGSGLTAYGLLWGRSWGQFAAVMTGWFGLALCIASVFVSPGVRIPLEPLLLIPFLVTMHRLKTAWKEDAGD
ncbi:MAG TPA: hypothetical protein VF737_07065 [Gemmatimonadaceae bacterium]